MDDLSFDIKISQLDLILKLLTNLSPKQIYTLIIELESFSDDWDYAREIVKAGQYVQSILVRNGINAD